MVQAWDHTTDDCDRCEYCNNRSITVTREGLFLCRKHLEEYEKEVVQSTLERFT